MSRLETKLTLWEKNELISEIQKEKIIEFENKDKKPHLLFAIISLGIFTTVLGIISLIAANWDNINGTVKLVVDFTILALISIATIIALVKNKTFWVEAGIFALFMMVGASIGLISQVFQTNGDIAKGVLAWSLFTIPLLAVSNKKLLPLFWVPLFTLGLFNQEFILRLFEPAILWFMEHISRNLAAINALGIIIYTLLAFIFGYINLLLRRNYPVFAVLRGYLEFWIYSSALILPMMGGIFFGYGAGFSIWQPVVSLVTFSIAAWIYYRQDSQRMLNLNIVLIGLTFLITYFRVFEDLLTTGFGLIFSGVFILAICWGIKIIMQKTSKTKGVK